MIRKTKKVCGLHIAACGENEKLVDEDLAGTEEAIRANYPLLGFSARIKGTTFVGTICSIMLLPNPEDPLVGLRPKDGDDHPFWKLKRVEYKPDVDRIEYSKTGRVQQSGGIFSADHEWLQLPWSQLEYVGRVEGPDS